MADHVRALNGSLYNPTIELSKYIEDMVKTRSRPLWLQGPTYRLDANNKLLLRQLPVRQAPPKLQTSVAAQNTDISPTDHPSTSRKAASPLNQHSSDTPSSAATTTVSFNGSESSMDTGSSVPTVARNRAKSSVNANPLLHSLTRRSEALSLTQRSTNACSNITTSTVNSQGSRAVRGTGSFVPIAADDHTKGQVIAIPLPNCITHCPGCGVLHEHGVKAHTPGCTHAVIIRDFDNRVLPPPPGFSAVVAVTGGGCEALVAAAAKVSRAGLIK